MRVKVVPLHTLGVGQDDLADAHCGELRPQTPHHFRPRKGQQQIDRRHGRRVRLERAVKRDRFSGDRFDSGRAARAVDDSHANLLAGLDMQDMTQVAAADTVQRHFVPGFARLEEQQVHGRGLAAVGSTPAGETVGPCTVRCDRNFHWPSRLAYTRSNQMELSCPGLPERLPGTYRLT